MSRKINRDDYLYLDTYRYDILRKTKLPLGSCSLTKASNVLSFNISVGTD